jgi:hypothetical protein
MDLVSLLVSLPYIIPAGYLTYRLGSRVHHSRKLRKSLERLYDLRLSNVAELSGGRVCFQARVRGDALMPAPCADQQTVGYRLVGMIELGVNRRSREKVVDLTCCAPFVLEDATGARVQVEASSFGLLSFPPQRHERRLSQLREEHRELVLDHASTNEEKLGKFPMHWTEWCLTPGDTVSVIGRVVEAVTANGVAADGELGAYRSPPVARKIVPLDGLPLLIIRGDETKVLSSLARNKLDYPEWLADFDL